MTLNLHLHIIYLLRKAKEAQATFGTLNAIGAGAAAQIAAAKEAAKEAAAKEAARKEAELKALKESLLARKEDATASMEVVAGERYDSSYEGEKVEQPKTTVTVFKDGEKEDTTNKQAMINANKEAVAAAGRKAEESYSQYAHEQRQLGGEPMSREAYIQAAKASVDMYTPVHEVFNKIGEYVDKTMEAGGHLVAGAEESGLLKGTLHVVAPVSQGYEAVKEGVKVAEILTSDSPNKQAELRKEGTSALGGLVGGFAGAVGGGYLGGQAGYYLGAALGSPLGPFGALAGATLGMAAGRFIGGAIGSYFGSEIGK